MNVAAWIFGILGIIMSLVIYQQKTSRGVLIGKLASDVVWAAHYLCLAAYSGFAVACIGICREIIFIKTDRKSRAGIIWLAVFCVTSVVCTVLTWRSAASILPATASLLSVVSFYFAIPKLSRYLALPIALCMGLYDFYVGSTIGIANEVLTVCSAVIGIIRLSNTKAN